MQSLKIATKEDIDTAVSLILKLKEESPYHSLSSSEEKVRQRVLDVLSMPNTSSVILLGLEGDKAIGILIGMIQELPFSEETMATEVIWYVEPEFRGTMGKELFEAFEYWANALKVTAIYTAAPNTKLEQYYETKGYNPVERIYMKITQWQ